MQDLNWNDLKYFLALCRSGRMAGAAARLRANETTVSRRIKALEGQLGAPVIRRAASGRYEPTPLGARLLDHALRIEAEGMAIANAAGQSHGGVGGSVRLSAVPQICNRVLVPHLPQLIARHPDLAIELVAEARNIDLTRREADLALRLARPAGGGLTVKARKIGRLHHGVYGPAQAQGADIQNLRWIRYDDSHASLPQAQWIARQTGPKAALRVCDIETAREAVAEGLGKTVLPVLVGRSDSRLRQLPTPAELPLREVWLLSHTDQQGFENIETVKAWLAALPWD